MEEPDLNRYGGPFRSCTNQTAECQIVFDQCLRQPRDAVTLPSHAHQRRRMVRCEHGFRAGTLASHDLMRRQYPAEPRGLAISKQRRVPLRIGYERPDGMTFCVGRADRDEDVRPHHNAPKSVGIETRRRAYVIMAKQEIDLPGEHDLFARLHAVRDQVESAERFEADVLADPAGEEGEGERVRRRNRQGRCLASADRPRFALRSSQGARQLFGERSEMGSRGREGSSLRAPLEQRSSDPILQSANAPAESGLSDVTGIRGA